MSRCQFNFSIVQGCSAVSLSLPAQHLSLLDLQLNGAGYLVHQLP